MSKKQIDTASTIVILFIKSRYILKFEFLEILIINFVNR